MPTSRAAIGGSFWAASVTSRRGTQRGRRCGNRASVGRLKGLRRLRRGFLLTRPQIENEDRLDMTASPKSDGFRTVITATLSVRNGPRAIAFYKAAFNAVELHRVDGDDGSAVAQMSVSGAQFWVADESPEHLNFSPESLGGCSVRLLLIVEDPDAVCHQAVAAGAMQVVPVANSHGWRLGRILDPFGHHWEVARPPE